MTNGYFNHDNPESKRTLARAESLNATLETVAAGFDLLPDDLSLKQGRVTWATATGGPVAYVVTLPFNPPTYASGLTFRFKVPAANTGACSVNVMGPTGLLGAKALKRFNGADTLANDLVAGAVAEIAYDGSQFVIVGAHGSSEVNAAASAAAAAVSATATGGAAPAGRMAWDTGTSAANPGSGAIRANSATISSITAVHISETDTDGASLSQVFAAWATSTNPVKGRLRIGARTALSKWTEADVTAVVDNGSWWTLTVANPTGPGGFAAGEIVAVGFARSGDKGVVSAYWGGAAGGTANDLTVATWAGLSALEVGQIVGVKIGAAANSGAATLAVDSVGPVAIRKNGSALVGGELIAGTDLWFQYDGTYFRLMGAGEDTKASVAAASTVDIGTTPARAITITAGTGPITAWGTAPAGAHRDITFSVPVTLTYNATSAILTGGGDINTMAGDTCRMESLGSGNWKMLSFQRANGNALGTYTAQALSTTDKSSNATLSNSNRTVTTADGAVASGRAALYVSTPIYWEVVVNTVGSSNAGVAGALAPTSDYLTNSAYGWGYLSNGNKGNGGGAAAFSSAWSAGDRLCFAYNPSSRGLWMGKVIGGVAVWGASGDPAAGANPAYTIPSGTAVFPSYSVNGSGASLTFSFAAGQQTATPPAGFTAFN